MNLSILVSSLIIFIFVMPLSVWAELRPLSGKVALETRIFPDSKSYDGQESSTLSPSLVLAPEWVWESDGDSDRFSLIPYLQWDAYDGNRTHFDLRELKWLHVEPDWDLVLGVDRVYWGVTESYQLIDIINQRDHVEDVYKPERLGQPMANLNYYSRWGKLSGFALLGFRERTFPDDDSRLRGLFPISEDDASYDSGAEEWHIDFAARWSQSFGSLDWGIYQFFGTSREPRFLPRVSQAGEISLIPHYDQISQTGLDLQYTFGAWLLKLESLVRSGQGSTFFASVSGFEYTLFQIFGTNADFGLLTEYLYDGRQEEKTPPTSFDNDIFLGGRFALNDELGTSIVGGGIVDLDDQTTFFVLEADRRINDNYKVELESRWFINVSNNDQAYGVRKDSLFTFRLVRFF